MTDPIVSSVAAVVAGKAAEAALQAGKAACTALIRLVRDRCHRDSQAAEALETACSTKDETAIALLTQALERLTTEDSEFADRLHDLWPRVVTELSADHGGVVNSMTGSVGGNLLQARDLQIEGGLHFGETRRSDQQ
jgi:hypothetical protein